MIYKYNTFIKLLANLINSLINEGGRKWDGSLLSTILGGGLSLLNSSMQSRSSIFLISGVKQSPSKMR